MTMRQVLNISPKIHFGLPHNSPEHGKGYSLNYMHNGYDFMRSIDRPYRSLPLQIICIRFMILYDLLADHTSPFITYMPIIFIPDWLIGHTLTCIMIHSPLQIYWCWGGIFLSVGCTTSWHCLNMNGRTLPERKRICRSRNWVESTNGLSGILAVLEI